MGSFPIIEIGKFNRLEVLKSTPQGLYVGDEVEEILLPNKYVPEGLDVGDEVDVFIYTDSEDRMIATTLTPRLQLGEFAWMKVKEVSRIGAFLEWGLEKDLLVPFKEQQTRMETGRSYLVTMYLDEVTDRLVGTTHVNRFLEREQITLDEGEEVGLLIGEKGELGYEAIVNNTYRGLIFENEIFRPVQPGDRTRGYVKKIREDKKIDLALERQGYESIDSYADRVYQVLSEKGGFLPLHDKSTPEEIKNELHMSKKNFKKAVGALYKKRIIQIQEEGIRLA